MAETQQRARIIYDFDGDTENGELTIREGDFITVLNTDIGDGWWEGQLDNGESGLFPESYVEILGEGDEQAAEDGINGYEDPVHNGGRAMEEDDFDQEGAFRHDSFAAPPRSADANKWDEEEDWEIQQREEEKEYRQEVNSSGGGATGSRSDVNSPSGRSSQIARAGTVRKNINRFSSFVKTGAENYILGRFPAKIAIQPSSRNKIVAAPDTNTSPMWEPNPDAYTIEVKDPEKKTKFKGIKSFLAYNVIPSSTGRAVSRRYKHYAWLHDRLLEKFSIHCIPPLPDKQYYGRYGEEFVEKRREKLQRWSNRIARHPVLSRSEVFIHFIHCDGEGQQWKTGKRRAEKDEVVGPVYLQTFYHPDVSIELATAEATVEKFGTFMHRFKLNLSRLRLKFIDHCQQMSGPFMTEFHKMSSSINQLASTFAMDDNEYAVGLTSAMKFTGTTYQEIGAMHAEQPRNDMLPALDVMKEYLGLIFAFPDVVTIHRGAASKVKECDKMKEEGRIDYTDATEITTRSESVSAVVLSEIYHFQHERIIDFRAMMKNFLAEQISFYKEIVRKLEEAKSQYSDGTDL